MLIAVNTTPEANRATLCVQEDLSKLLAFAGSWQPQPAAGQSNHSAPTPISITDLQSWQLTWDLVAGHNGTVDGGVVVASTVT
jgi:hypothetical protein